MKTRNSTKSKLLSSVIALVLCVSMLIGATFAWFTDTASTAVNKIQAGTLDVALEMYDGTNWVNAEGQTLQFKKAAGATEGEQVLWEPGCTYELPELRIVNNGDLALKYKIQITGIDGSAKLNEAIDWTMNDAAINSAAEYYLAPKDKSMTIRGNNVTDTSASIVIKGTMQTSAGNEYQGLTIDGIGITVFATQVDAESDSFGNTYDQGATTEFAAAVVLNGASTPLEKSQSYTIGSATVTVDAGGNISYTNSGAAQTVSITTHGGNLTVDAPNDTIYHYGTADSVTINAIKGNSFHEFGEVAVLSIAQGRVVVENGDNIGVIQVKPSAAAATNPVVIAVPENVVLDTKIERTNATTAFKLDVLNSNGTAIEEKSKEVNSETIPAAPSGELEKVLGPGGIANDVKNYVARIGNDFYVTLADAIGAVPTTGGDQTVITMLCDVKNAAGMKVVGGKNFVVDFNGYTYELNKPGAGSTNTETNGFQLLKDSTIVMKNGTITISEENLTPATNGRNIKRIIQNYAKLTLQDMTIDGTNQYGGADHVMSFNNDPVLITGNTNIIAAEGEVAFDADGNWGGYNRSQVTIDTTGTIVGNIELGQGILTIKNANVKGGVVFCTSCGETNPEERISITGGNFTVGSGTALNNLLGSISADASNVTINLANDINLTSVLEIGNSVTINGNGHSIYNTANRVIRITKPNLDVKLYDLGIISKCTATSDVRGISFDNTTSNSSLLLDGCTVSASFYAINIVTGPSKLNITIKNGTVAAGWAAINCYANDSTFTIENSVLRGLNDKGESSWNDFATIVFDGNGLWNAKNIGVNGSRNTMKITNSTIYASSESSNKQAWLAVQYGAQNETITVDANTKIIDANGNDQTDTITIDPFVGYNNSQKKYEKSYDTHSVLTIGTETVSICYHGEIDDGDNGALVSGGTHVPFDGCTGSTIEH